MTEHKEVEPTKLATPDATLLGEMNFGEMLQIDFNREIIGVDTGRVVAKFTHFQDAKSFIDLHNAQLTQPNTTKIHTAEYEQLKADAERYRWLANDCDGNEQDDFTQWLSRTVASRVDIDEVIDELRIKNE